MSQTKLCRLCVKVCTDYASLYNETGQKNNICEITLQYFDPMFLNADHVPESAVLCLECCGHISVFHTFQQAVFQAQWRLREGEKEIELEFKTKVSEELILDNMDNSHVTVKQDDSISLPDLELVEEFMFADNLPNEGYRVNSQTVIEPIPQCENTEEEEEDSEQSKDQPLSTYDTSESENGSDSDDNQPTTSLKRKRERKPLPTCENTEEFGDKIFIDNFDTEQSKDQPISTSDTSEKGSDSDGNQPKTRMRRKHKRTQKLLPEDVDAFIAQWKPSLDCVVCKKSVANFKSLREHFSLEHPNESCRVECCNRRFYHRCRVAAHARLHFNPDKVKCNQCDSYYASISGLRIHMSLAHLTTNIEISDRIGNSNLRSKSSIECVICKTSFAEFSLLKSHYRQDHPTEVFYVLCCKRKFYWPYLFEEHMRLHRDPNAFKCEICGKRLRRSGVLKRHMRNHRDPKTFECEICGKRLCRSDVLREHMQLHRDPNAFNCKICGKRFGKSQAIREHTQLHRDPNAFKCEICSKRLCSSAVLKRHIRKCHSDIKAADP